MAKAVGLVEGVKDSEGNAVRAYDDGGTGPALLIVHGAQDDGRAYRRLARPLTTSFRVVRLARRQYRVDLPGGCSMADEVEHVLAVAAAIGRPVVFGHSSGGVLALEALVAAPDAFSGAFVYEPPLVDGPPLGGEAARMGKAALAAGRPIKAMTIFTRAMVGAPAVSAALSATFVAMSPRHRPFIPRVFDDVDAIDALGSRLDAYARIDLPLVLVEGARSPAHFGRRLDALARARPDAERVTLPGRGHTTPVTAPRAVVRLVTTRAPRFAT